MGVVAVLLIAVDIYAARLILRQQQLMQDISRYNVTWLTTQAGYELARLQMAAGAYAAEVPSADVEEVQLRLDIVLNRVQLLESGELASFVRGRPELAEIARRFRQGVESAQPIVDKFDEEGAPRRLLTLLSPLNAPLARLSAAALDYSETLMARDLDRLSRLYWVVTGVLVLLIGSSGGLVLLVILNNRALRAANDNVNALVRDLRHSGSALTVAMADVQERNRVLQDRDRTLHTQNARFDAALNNMSQALIMVDGKNRLIVSNVRYTELFGLGPDDATPGTSMADLATEMRRAGRYGPALLDSIWSTQLELATSGRSALFFQEDEQGYALSVSHQPMPEGGWVATYEDITERRFAEAQVQHTALHDALTNLPNRRLFYSRLEAALENDTVAVHCIDLDFFKQVNDTLGHPVGDALLEAVARRLRHCVRGTDLVARLGGDEFAILQPDATEDSARELADRVLASLRAPYDLDGRRAVISASIGIALSGEGISAERLFCNADLALYGIKGSIRGTFRFFEPGMEAAQASRYAVEFDLREALGRDEFQIHYQPIFDLQYDRISGYEALVRWFHPERGTVGPAQFIPVAEEAGLISAIGEWVLLRACMDAVQWRDPVKVAVNLSPMQFQGDDLVRAVTSALAASGLKPNRLELEITESVLLQKDDRVLGILHQLRDLGIRTVLDDFGTGYSSLSYLRSFPFDKIKVDQSFVRDMDSQPDCMVIINSVSNLAEKLGMATTVEGVETEAQLEQLRKSGITEVQGYLLGRPAPNTSIDAGPADKAPRVAGRRQAADTV